MLVTWTGDLVTSRLDLAVWLIMCSQLLSLTQPTENFMVLGSLTDIFFFKDTLWIERVRLYEVR